MTKILVIEDTPIYREMIEEILAVSGFQTVSAGDGLEGVQMAHDEHPDLIICDITMPRLDGYGVLEQLRQNPLTATIPFIFLTGNTARADVRRGMELGADDYLPKPFTEEELLQAVNTRLAKQATVIGRFQQKMDALRHSIARSLPHELNTPLNGILAGAELLKEGPETLAPEEVVELAQIIYESAERLNRLIANYLLYAELATLELEPVKAAALKRSQTRAVAAAIRTIAQRQATAASREADLILDLEDGCVALTPGHFEKIVAELVNNAFKFSKAGSAVEVVSRQTEHTLDLAVADHGRGMTAEQRDAIGAYMQFDRRSYEQQGSGMGLAIVQRLTKLYEGEMTIASTPGERTTVHVRLPLDKRMRAAGE